MEEDTDFSKLPIEEKCVHKLWKVRVQGYEECSKIFKLIDDEKSPEWNKYQSLMKKFVVDSNAVAQEKALEAVLAFVENAASAGKLANDIMSGIVTKCIAAPKVKTKDLSVQIVLMLVEIEKQEAVQEELIKGTDAKNPKIVSACISTLTLSLKEFGPKVVNIKPLIKKIPGYLEDRDKQVREEAKNLTVEIYRWIGAPLKQQLNALKPLQLSELETEFNNLKDTRAKPSRYLKSQKPKVSCQVNTNSDGGDEECDSDGGDDQPEIDPYEIMEAVDILSKLPKDFFEKVESKKWQDRKEGLEALETLAKNPKLKSGDYGDVVRVLKKIIAKDSNIVVVCTATKCMTGLAAGLKKSFHPYAVSCISTLLEKFREKKQNVVLALREAADAVFQSIDIEAILEEALGALDNKNPSVKSEAAAFLTRCFAKTQTQMMTKKLLKSYSIPLTKLLNDPDPGVRDSSSEALGMAMKLVGEKMILPFLADLDNLKMAKIKDAAEKAVILVKMPTTKKSGGESSKSGKASSSVAAPAATKKPVVKSGGANKASTKRAAAPAEKLKAQSSEQNLSEEEITEAALKCFPEDVVNGLNDTNWKVRLEAVERLLDSVKQMDSSEVSSQLIVRLISRKPGFKDSNFQVVKLRLEVVKTLAENYSFSKIVCEYCLTDVIEKLGDPKNSALAGEALTSIAEATSLDYIATESVSFAFNQKSPKIQQETLLWLSRALLEFGCVSNVKEIIEILKKALSATVPGVRTAAITLLGTMYLFLGKPMLSFFDNEKSALKKQIEQECEKMDGQPTPQPSRRIKSGTGSGDDGNGDSGDARTGQSSVADLIPRVDIGNLISEALLNELADKNWKVRHEGLQKFENILKENKFIKGSLKELPHSLALRLVDSNSKIVQTTLGLCESLATAMGPPIKQHIRTLFPNIAQCLGDSKTWIRSAAISCMNAWGDQAGYKEFFDGDMVGDILKSGSPVLRTEFWTWLAEKLPDIPPKSIPREELLSCVPVLYNNLEDRSVDVRKNAQEAVLGFMLHLNYEGMLKQTEKLKPGSKNVVVGILEKVRPFMPVKPLPSRAVEEDQPKTVKSGGAMKAAAGKAGGKAGKQAGGPAKSSSASGQRGKKDDDVDTSPLLQVNNLKHQRVIDEQKLKVLKWNFTTPREEFVDLLKELMSQANVNRSLIANMFHADFRYHLKAIESLVDDLPDNGAALKANLDLVLKWLTLRFFDTNPSVLLKGLDYLQIVFNLLIEDGYHMLDNEAASFIPYLIIKIGEPKEPVRNGVRALFKQIALVYPVSRLFSYVMEGLKSKNARQRAECLDLLGSLIENYGVSVCQPSPTAALKEIAKQIADRDNTVRNSALNCIVQAYFLEGEKIYKYIGQISEKDQSLLDERIKRAAKSRPSRIAPPEPPSKRNSMLANHHNHQNSNNIPEPEPEVVQPEEEEEEEEEEILPPPRDHRLHQQQPKVKMSGPFGLDMDLLNKIEAQAPAVCRVPKLLEPDIDCLETSVSKTVPAPVIPIVTSPTKISYSKPQRTIASLPQQPQPPQTIEDFWRDENVDRTILGMASLDLPIAIASMGVIEKMLKSPHASRLQSKEDAFINSINMQLKILQTYSPTNDNPQVSKGYRTCFMIILTFYDTGLFGRNVGIDALKEHIDQMVGFLADNKLSQLSEQDTYIRVINTIVLKIIMSSDHTNVICTLIQLLHERSNSLMPTKHEELIMKCLWKIVKLMPSWAGDLDYDRILLEIHNFFRDYPSAWWKKQKKPDTPMRTIKTILHSMTKVKGSTILSHLTLVHNTNESELRSYIMRLITTFKPDDYSSPNSKANARSGGQSQNVQFLKQLSKQLSDIFKKIGSNEHSQEGLMQLYEFKKTYPEVDIQPFLDKSHTVFQDFIKKELSKIEQSRQTSNSKPLAQKSERNVVDDPQVKQWMERLRALEKQNGK